MDQRAPSIESIVQRYCEQLRILGVHPQKVILFGSRARQEGDNYSDIDLLVVSSDFRGMGLRARLETLGIAAARVWEPIEAIAASPEDLQQVEPADFLSEVLRTGKVVWEEK
jgi:predicted nucleotidyltransferase